ncbi:MAG: chromate transporter [Alphaproteobacteria bacterium]|nr:chromate transporter [Alphaproteobacteria bacterium]
MYLKQCILLYRLFFKIGLFTFGGGYAMLPFLEKELVKKGLATEEELMDDYAVSQMTPGIIAVNVSTFIGTKIAGFWGALFALLGIITPSFFIISTLSLGFFPLLQNPKANKVIAGILIAVLVLLIPMIFKMVKKNIVGKRGYFIAFLSLLLSLWGGLSAGWIIFGGIIFGLFLYGREE